MLSRRRRRIEQTKRTLDYLAYSSLFLDVCIAVITTFSLLGVGSNHELFLTTIAYLLTVVVVMSIGSFAVLLVLKHEETILVRLLGRRKGRR